MKIAELKTKLGTIVVEQSGYTECDYPGYSVFLLNDKKEELAAALFEVDETSETPELKVHIWDTTQDEPVCNMCGCVSDNSIELVQYE